MVLLGIGSRIRLWKQVCSCHHSSQTLFQLFFLPLCTPSRLPKYSCQFIEMCLMVTADHGPAVSGAHNTIICARAGKDLVSSLTSGLLTIVSLLLLQGNNSGVMLPQCSRLLLGAPGYKCPEQMLFRASWLVCEARKTITLRAVWVCFSCREIDLGVPWTQLRRCLVKRLTAALFPWNL